MLRKLVLAVSFSTLAAFSGSVLAAAFDVTDIEGTRVWQNLVNKKLSTL